MLLPWRDDVETATAALLLVLPGIAAAIAGGRAAAVTTALAAAAVFNVGFVEPHGSLHVDFSQSAVALVVLLTVAAVTASLVAREADRRSAAERRTAEVVAARAEHARLSAEAMALGLAAEHRSALLRAVSHDLRTPLSTIRAVASDLRDGSADYDVATRDELLDLVIDEAERLDRLVANLLSFSRVDAGALHADRQVLAIDEVLDQCVRRHTRLVRDRAVSVSVPLTLPLVDADWTLVDQAVSNLVANAARHSPPGTRIMVSARRVDDQWVEIAVADQGPGIPPELHDVAFEPFRRGPGSTSSGIGLAIVRAVAEAHGGSSSIHEGPSGGAEVRFTLPVHHG